VVRYRKADADSPAGADQLSRGAVVMTRVAGRREAPGSGGPAFSPLRGAAGPPDGSADHQADDLVSDLYQAHALALVRMAKLLLSDQASAEDVVQDSFLGLYKALPRLRDHDQILPY
jgi:hypothetical protein